MAMQDNHSSTELIVSYDGDALSEHRMDAQELGTALIALGELFDRANLLLNGEGTSIELEVQATPEGSFEIELFLAQAFHIAAPFLARGLIASAADLITLVVGTDGLITLIKRLKGKKPGAVSDENSSGRVTLEIEGLRTEGLSVDYLYVDAPSEVWRMYQDKKIIDAAVDVVSPLFKDGIDSVNFRQASQELESVAKDEAPYFQMQDGSVIEEFIIPRQELVVVAPYLGQGSSKWRLRNHHAVRWYAMKDDQFRADVVNGVRKFGADDILICEVKVINDLEADNSQYEILRVIDHIPRAFQDTLF